MAQGAGKLGKRKGPAQTLRKGHSHAKKKKKHLKEKVRLDAHTGRKVEAQMLAGMRDCPDGSYMKLLQPDQRVLQQIKTEEACRKGKSQKKKQHR